MKRTILLVSCLIVLALWNSAAHAAELYKDRLVAVVNGDVILFSDLEKQKQPLTRSLSVLPIPVTPPGKWPTEKEILDELIIIKLLEQEAARKGVTVEDQAVDASIDSIRQRNNLTHDQFVLYLAANGANYADYRQMMKRQFVLRKLIQLEVGQKIALSEEDAQNYFKGHRDRIEEEYKSLAEPEAPRSPEEEPKPEIPTHETIYVGGKVRLRQITLSLPADATTKKKQEVIAKAKKIMQDVQTGADFAELAKKYSDDAYAKSGGDLGTMDFKGLRPELQQMVQRMKKGSVTPPITSRNGLLIFYLADESGRTPKQVPIPDKVRKQLENQWKEAMKKRGARNAPNPGKADKTDVETAKEKDRPVQNLGILSAEDEKEYRKAREKVYTILRTQKIKERMNQWIEELKKNSIIDVKL
ncbi:MAG: peptidylprolyl isomerase [Desulfomonile sp.]|nr:peptidylprolyl isomerase [Desulfomonile sp.]